MPDVIHKQFLCIMDPKEGDEKVSWDKDDKESVNQARARFDELKKKGWTAYAISKGSKSERILDKFDPEAEQIIMCPLLAGG